MFSMRQLDIYLNDHLAGAMVGVELSRRVAKSNRATPSGEFLGRLHREIVEDRRTLQAVARALGAESSPMKPAFAWIAEKAGRLKPNGQIRGYSPLSRLVELEGLEIGVTGNGHYGRRSATPSPTTRDSRASTSRRSSPAPSSSSKASESIA